MTVDILWKKLPIEEVELSLVKVLRCGQTFRWKNINNVWSFTTDDRIILLRQEANHLHYSHVMLDKPKHAEKETFEFIKDYFNLPVNLSSLYEHWSIQHNTFKRSTKDSPFSSFKGIRILRQDPWETLISFICSSNNNVKRISKMCDNLCVEFGDYINEYEGHKYYSFPGPSVLAKAGVEARLRDLGFGYRAKYIYQTACKFEDNEAFPDITLNNLNQLRDKDYETAHEFLLQMTGVGPKVADCICLMALDKHDIVPVDTHVYQIAIRDYNYKGKRDLKTMNKVVYASIRQYFKDVFGPYAGWAQSVLFASDLADLDNGINQIDEVKVEKRVKNEIEVETVVTKRIKVEKVQG